jgi:hypothetical protein
MVFDPENRTANGQNMGAKLNGKPRSGRILIHRLLRKERD